MNELSGSSGWKPNVQMGFLESLGLVGIGLALTGAIIGIQMAAKTTPIECPDDYISHSADPHCSAHLHAGVGGGLLVLSLMLGLLILLACLLAAASLRRGPLAREPARG
jgi:hypothetical protein